MHTRASAFLLIAFSAALGAQQPQPSTPPRQQPPPFPENPIGVSSRQPVVRDTNARARRANVRPVTPIDSAKLRDIGSDGIYDIVLDVPNLSVDEIVLDVNGVEAHVALDARVAKLVELSAGADVVIQRVYLGIRGVQAEAHLKVDLDNVATIVDRVLTTLDRNPEIVSGLLATIDNTVNTVGGVANTALQPGGVVSEALNTVGGIANTVLQPGGAVSQLVGAVGGTLNNLTGQGGLLSVAGVNALGNTLIRTVDASGRLVEGTLDGTGKLVTSTGIGNVLNLPVLSQTLNPSTGQILRTVQDVSGALIQVTLDNAGKVLGTTVLRQATGLGGQVLGAVGPTASAATQSLGGVVGGIAGTAGGVTGAVGNVAGAVPNIVGGQRGRVESVSGGEVAIGSLIGPTNPLGNVAGGVTGAVGGALGTVQQLVLTSTLNAQGQTVQRVVDAAGALLERVVNPATGQVLSTRSLGNVLSLPLVREQLQSNGSLLRVVRDATGNLLELNIGQDGVLKGVKSIASDALKVPALP